MDEITTDEDDEKEAEAKEHVTAEAMIVASADAGGTFSRLVSHQKCTKLYIVIYVIYTIVRRKIAC